MTEPVLDFKAATLLLEKSANVALVSHEYTDGDDLGAMLAVYHSISARGQRCQIAALGGVPANLMFMPGVQEVSDQPPAGVFDLKILFGCNDPARTGFKDWVQPQDVVLNVDHHPDNQYFGRVNLVDATASATSEVVYFWLKHMGVDIDKAVAMNLLTGIFYDTGGFRHANTSARVMEIAAELIRRGARIDRISEYFAGHSELPKLRAWAKALENARFDPGKKLVYSIVTEEELKAIGATSEDLEGVASLLNTVPEAKYSLVLKQRGDEIKGSLRSEEYKGVDVGEIARTLGGGGHKLAAGFKMKGKIEKTSDGWKIT